MATETVYHCEGPLCDAHQQSMQPAPIRGWIQIRAGWEPGESHDFCGWDCVLKYAAKFDPMEAVEFGPDPTEGDQP